MKYNALAAHIILPVWYFTTPRSAELDTHVAHGRTRPLAQLNTKTGKSKGFDDSLIQIPIERSRNAAHIISHLLSVA